MVNNNYLESYKIQVVRRMLSGEHLKIVSQELGIIDHKAVQLGSI